MTDIDSSLLLYTGRYLDRSNPQCTEPKWLHDTLHSLDTRVVPYWRGKVLIMESEQGPSALTLTGTHARGLLQIAADVVFLGLGEDDTAYFAADGSHHEGPVLTPIMGRAQFMRLSEIGPQLSPFDASLLAQAHGFLHWHGRHRFCGLCGAETELEDGGAHRACTGEDCGVHHSPSATPTVITLVTRPGPDGGACLLTRQPGWPEGMYGTLWHFVAPGESLEDSCRRLVAEKVGLQLRDVTYHASQPLPLPTALMTGFHSSAQTVRVDMDAASLEDARWFTKKQLREAEGLSLPGPHTLSGRLIADWLES